MASSNRPQNKRIVDPATNRLDLLWDAYFGRLEAQIAAVPAAVAAIPALPSIGSTLLTSGTVSTAATLDIVLTAYTGYRALKFVLQSFIPVTDDVELWMRLSTDGGATFDVTTYAYSAMFVREASGPFNASTNAARILIAGSTTGGEAVSNVSAEAGVDAEITLYDQTTSQWPRVNFQSAYQGATVTDLFTFVGSGQREVSQDTDAVRFLFESGNIASGKYAVYGLN